PGVVVVAGKSVARASSRWSCRMAGVIVTSPGWKMPSVSLSERAHAGPAASSRAAATRRRGTTPPKDAPRGPASPSPARRASLDPVARGGQMRGRGIVSGEYRSSGRWEADIDRVAADCLAVAQRARSGVERPAVVFDIDETLLSNWPYEIANDFARITSLFVEWARRSECPPLEPVKRFFVTMRDAGIACFVSRADGRACARH